MPPKPKFTREEIVDKAFELVRETKIKEGQEAFNGGHSAHGELLSKFANGELPPMDILLTHAEDQLMSAEAFGILAEKFITLYQKVNG